jgi:hypothetical protein
MKKVLTIVFCGLILLGFNAAVQAQAKVTVNVTTKTYSGKYAPKNSAMMWIQTPAPENKFIKTIKKFAAVRIQYCTAWNAVSKGDVDGLTGATRSNHTAPIQGVWDLTGQDDQKVPNGTYEVCVEFTEINGTGKIAKGQLVIDNTSKTLTVPDAANFTNFTAVYESGVSSTTFKSVKNLNEVQTKVNTGSMTYSFQSSSSYKIKISTLNGRLMTSLTGNDNSASVDTRSFVKGLYLVDIIYDGQQLKSVQLIR